MFSYKPSSTSNLTLIKAALIKIKSATKKSMAINCPLFKNNIKIIYYNPAKLSVMSYA